MKQNRKRLHKRTKRTRRIRRSRRTRKSRRTRRSIRSKRTNRSRNRNRRSRRSRRVKAGDSPLVNEKGKQKEGKKEYKEDVKTKSIVDKSLSNKSMEVDKLKLIYIYHEIGKHPNQIPETIRVEKSSAYNLTSDGDTFNITGDSLSLSLEKPRIYKESDNTYLLTSGTTRINFKIDKTDRGDRFNYPEKDEELPYFKSS